CLLSPFFMLHFVVRNVGYQTPGGDPSPPFAEYVSGHSTFSSAAAEILQRFTGSDDFGGSVTF
ncbi:hypothetical protein, partial [Dapis sp. BLCC M229]|uniref:hypothetical protein n=1 Tax=Dapis sp. BLCC M229 TaxID=3400188 RepID=UPI003CF89AAE